MTNQTLAPKPTPHRSAANATSNPLAASEDASGIASRRRSEELPDLLTVAELATYLGVTRKAIYRLRDKRKAPSAIWLQSGLRFARASVLQWVERESTSA